MTQANELVRSSLRDQVLAVLKQRLVSGEFKPGEIYSAQAVAAELGVSGSPVREAMLTLSNQGLLRPVRNRGFQVVEVSAHDRDDIYEMRLWLEVPAMAKLADNGSLSDADQAAFRSLANQITAAARAGDVVAFLEADRDFHMGLIDLLSNTRLSRTVGELRDQTRLYGLEHLRRQGLLVDSALEHEEILDALLAQDPSRTADLMRAHIGHVRGDWA